MSFPKSSAITFDSLFQRLLLRLQSPLYRNSLYLMAGALISAAAGFVFWWVSARLTSRADVGLATSILASINLVRNLGEVGTSATLIHYGARRGQQGYRILNTIVRVKWILLLILTIGFIILIPWVSPGLKPILESPLVLLVFIAFTTMDSILALQDLAMLNLGNGRYVFLRQLACNLPPTLLVLMFYLVGSDIGYQYLFFAFILPNLFISMFTGFFVVPRYYPKYTFFGKFRFRLFTKLIPYGAANYLSDLLWSLPSQLLPLATINLIDAENAAVFNISWLIFNTVLIIQRVSATSMFVEGSKSQAELASIAMRTVMFVFTLSLPVIVGLWLFGGPILSFFGAEYQNTMLLNTLLFSTLPFIINGNFFTALRTRGKRFPLIFYSAFNTSVVALYLSVLPPIFGVIGVAYAWLAGQLTTMIIPVSYVIYVHIMERWQPQKALKLVILATLFVAFWSNNAIHVTAQNERDRCEFEAYRRIQISSVVRNSVVLDCDFMNQGTLNSKIYVIDRNDDLNTNQAEPILDANQDLWIFDYINDGFLELVIDFEVLDDGSVKASLYDNIVLETQMSNVLQILEDRRPTVVVTSLDGWWKQGDKVSYNLDIQIDGTIIASSSPGNDLTTFDVINDGVIDYNIVVRDIDDDGLPDYDWRTRLFIPEGGIFNRTNIVYNVNDDERHVSAPLPWPYINRVTYKYLPETYNESGLPPIQVNWDTGQIEYVGEIVSSLSNENLWRVNTIPALTENTTNSINFESPTTRYDIAEDNDHFPELSVRTLYYPPYDPFYKSGSISFPLNEVRYSWDQDNDNSWDYKLGLVGSHPISSTITLPDTTVDITMLDYSSIPTWIVGNTWDLATFVAVEDTKVSGEGIYEWDLPPPLLIVFIYREEKNPLTL